MNNISPFNRVTEIIPPVRDDVGIVPYKETWDAFHSSNRFRLTGGHPFSQKSKIFDSFPRGEAKALALRKRGKSVPIT